MSSPIQIIPAIDLMDGKCVRLVQGKKDSQIVYSDDPPAMARFWQEQGAERLHIVDLDGAFEGEPANMEVIRKIRDSVSMKIEAGGGIRSSDSVQNYLDAGVDFVILGTKAFKEPDWLEEQVKIHGQNIIVGLDAKQGKLASHGWTVTEEITAVDFAKKLEQIGVETIIYTDVARDGMLSGPNLDSLGELASSVNLNIIASGGIHKIDDVHNIKNLGLPNITGIITGKALYEKTLDLREAISVTQV